MQGMTLSWALDMPLGTPPHETEVTRLVAASRKGDADAFAYLVRLHERRVFRLVGRFFRRREDVEELAQETFLTAWRRLETYRSEAPFEHWLTRVCLRCCYHALRRRKTWEERTTLEHEPAAASANPDAALLVERLLRELRPEDRFILLMLEGEGRSVAEIADRLGWTRINVKVRAYRARRKLRALLEQGVER
jgi:RNA polymerase sigma-70 factor (ECF subfamily)